MEPKQRRKNGWLLLLLLAVAASEPARACQIGVQKISGGKIQLVLGERRPSGELQNEPPGQGLGNCLPEKVTVGGQAKSHWKCTWSLGSGLQRVSPEARQKIARFLGGLQERIGKSFGIDTSGVANSIKSASCNATVEGQPTSTREWKVEVACGSQSWNCDLYESPPAR